MYTRLLPIGTQPDTSFFLWGPRQVGKSTFLAKHFPKTPRIDLLNSADFSLYSTRPSTLFEELEASGQKFIIIDEIQKVPQLLDEVHRLIEQRRIVFGLCGSSARKLRRGHANLLGGRALRYEMFGLVSAEVGSDFHIDRFVSHGVLPRHFQGENPKRLLRAYVEDYLKEEIAQEGLVRNLPAFSEFLRAAAIGDTEIVNYQNIARECAVSAPTVKEYYQILFGTLLGTEVPAFTRRQKRRVISAPKFYFRDVGIVNHLAKRGRPEQGSAVFGKAFENWICHELAAYRSYSEKYFDLSYWRLASGIEVDFLLGDAEVGVEVKGVPFVADAHLNGLRQLATDHPSIKMKVVVALERRARKTEDGIWILPVREFLEKLWNGELPVEEG